MTAADPVAVARAELGDRARPDEPMGRWSTYRVGGPAALFVEAGSPDDLTSVARAHQASGLPVLVVGNGSNLLVADSGFVGVVIHLGDAFATVGIQGDAVEAGAAASLPVVARQTVAAGLTGFEWAVGVPGTIGGAVRMNAGGHGSDMASVLVGVHIVDLSSGQDGWVDAAELDLGYRHSSIGPSQVVTAARLSLRPGDPDRGSAELGEIVRWRRENQPGGPNAGSVFTNPAGDSAGRLIDTAGGKGLRRGTAAVSDKHANFIQADPGGRADDVVAVMAAVRALVLDRTGIALVPETRLVGFPDAVLAEVGAATGEAP